MYTSRGTGADSGMRTAAMVLAIIGGVIGIVVGFFGYGFVALGEIWAEFVQRSHDVGVDGVVDDPAVVRVISLAAPVLAIAGGAMTPSRPLIGAILSAGSAYGMHSGFGFNVFTMFPIVLCAAAAGFAVLGAVLPSREASH